MPMQIEHDGQQMTVYTESEFKEKLDSEVKGLKITVENLKAEKTDVVEKLKEQKDITRQMEEAKAKAEGDKETLERLAAEREAEERNKFAALQNMIKSEKVGNALADLVTEIGAGGKKNKHLMTLLKAEFDFDYDIDGGQVLINGGKVPTVAELRKSIEESGEYDDYLAGSKATGGFPAAKPGSGVATKKFHEYTGAELKAIKDSDPAQYERLRSEYYAN